MSRCRPDEVPDYVTHYYRADRRPFMNLSHLDEPELATVIDDLGRLRDAGTSKRVFGRRYMEPRRLTESRMRELFIASGGKPIASSPHYFVLGFSRWFEGLAPGTQSIELPLSLLPIDQTSITYPDSFAAMEFGPQFGLPQEKQPYHGKVFRLDELHDLVAEYGLPEDEAEAKYAGYERRSFEKYIEVQLWTDEPVRQYLSD